MSFDLGVWYPQTRITDKDAGRLYKSLCDGDTSGVAVHPEIETFYAELTAKHPQIDTIPEDRVDDHDYCPWSCILDHSPGHVIMSCVWSDPQTGTVTYPDGSTGKKDSSRSLRWILGFFALLFAAIFVYSEQLAPSKAPLLVYSLAGLCGLMAGACFRQAWRRNS